jgi:hypothetical protein
LGGNSGQDGGLEVGGRGRGDLQPNAVRPGSEWESRPAIARRNRLGGGALREIDPEAALSL